MEINTSRLAAPNTAGVVKGRVVQAGDQRASAAGFPLLPSDIALIRAATGIDFDWPPEDGKGVPEVALDISAWRMRQGAAGEPWNKLGSADLQHLRSRGVITSAFLDKALAAVRSDEASRSDSQPQARQVAATTTSTTAPATSMTRVDLFT